MTDTNFIEVDYNPFEGEREIEKIVSLNESQKEIWLSCVIGGDPANLAYNESVSLELKGDFRFDAFQNAIDALINRHEALRSTVSKNGESLIIYNKIESKIIYNDYTNINSKDVKNRIKDFVQQEISLPFNLYDEPLFRIYLHKIDEETYYFTIIIHHLVGDGWSLGIILEDISIFYSSFAKGTQPPFNLPEQISDYALDQAIFKHSTEYTDTQNYWLNLYKNDIPVMNMPLDFIRPTLRTYEGKRNDFVVDRSLYNGVKSLSAKAKTSVVSTLIAAFEVFLYNQTGQEDIVLGLPAAGQLATEHLTVVGHCVNLLPLRSKIDPNVSFINYLNKRRNEIYDAYDHQKLTFSELLNKLNIKRNKANIPLVPVVFNVDRGMDDNVDFYNLSYKIISNPRVCQTFEISLNVNGSKDSMIFEWAYNTQLFTSQTINRMMDDFVDLLKTISSNPDVLISELFSRENPFPEISRAFCDYPKDKTIVDLFNEIALQQPNQKAITIEGKSLTYQILDQKSNQLANYLIEQGIKQNALVPICIHPSLEMIVGILGILKAGAAYVPIDPEYPTTRIKYLVDESKSPLIVSDKLMLNKLKDSVNVDVVELNDDKHLVWKAKSVKPSILVNPSDLIYVIYTSGSTGNPKGVMIEHRSIVDYLFGLKSKLTDLKDCTTFALGSAISTDLGNTTLFSALTLGAELHLFAKDRFNNVDYIHSYFKQNKIDFLKIVPSHWKYLTKNNRELFPEKLLMFGGESLPDEFIKNIVKVDAACKIVNHYGPTETTIGKLIHIVNKDYDYAVTVPIGQPFSNSSVHVLNKHLKYCAIGVPGELYIGGDGVARGYLNNDELTEQSFIQNPNTNFVDNRIYKTGDLVKWLPNGNIEYLGRIDDQVKIRGNRIELGEIYNVLQKHPNVKQSAVLTEDIPNNEKQLIAYVVTEEALDKDHLISFMRTHLPEYMIPRVIIKLDEIPLTSNGKVDRKSLPKRDMIDFIEENIYIAPKNEYQELIVKIWSEALGINQISVNDDFFELGGHSMIAIKVMVEIEKHTGKRLPLSILFDNSTVEKLALHLNKDDEDVSWSSLVPIKKSGTKPPLYIIHGQGMNIIIFKSLTNQIDPDQPIYGVQPKGLNPTEEPLNSIEEIAAEYINEIIKDNPNGPYLLMGYSSGGTIALEMSEQFKKMGKKVSFLGLLDTYYDGDSYKEMIKSKNYAEILDYTFKFFGYGFVYLFKHPVAFIKHKISFTYGTLYNNYKKIKPIKPDLSNPKYVLHKIQKAHHFAFKNYKLKKYNTDVHLFRANDKKLSYVPNTESNGWAPYINGELSFIDIPLEHLKFFDPKYVQVFAEKLQKVLDEIKE